MVFMGTAAFPAGNPYKNSRLSHSDKSLKILRIQTLHKHYQKDRIEIPALRGICLDVDQGTFVSIVGPSGSGKSTLLNLIGGLDTATSGHIYIGDKDLARMNRTELARHRRNTVGMIFQSFNLISSQTALENVELALAFANTPRKQRKKLAAELLDQVGLTHRLNHKPGELSGGEAQRVAIARALANQPVLLLADEPTGNLDSKTSKETVSLLKKLNEEKKVTVLMVTHEEEIVKRVSHRMIHLLDGKVDKEESLGSFS
jgi:putative ABC transport system ATP-binding protein